MKLVDNYETIIDIESRYKRKGTASNNFLLKNQYESLILNGKLLFINGINNCFLFERKATCLRMYYFINDFNEDISTEELHNVVVEILYRTVVPKEDLSFLMRNGFKMNLQRDLLFANYEDLHLTTIPENICIRYAETLEEVKIACEYFNSIFDHYSGDYISPIVYSDILAKHQLLVARDTDDVYLGAFHISEEKNVNWGSHLAVFPEARGKGVGVALFNEFIRLKNNGPKTKYMHWVQHQNEIAVHMYLKMGYKYMNKSTISLIK